MSGLAAADALDGRADQPFCCSGKTVKRFTVVITCPWSDPRGQETGVLDEAFTYSNGHYSGTANSRCPS